MLLAALVLAGCGSDRTQTPGVTTPIAQGSDTVTFPDEGISFKAPKGWNVARGKPPLVASIQTGQATIAIWRYPRSEKLPRTPAELEAARQALLAVAKQRDPSFEEIKSAPARVDGKPAVQIRARETIEGQKRIVRSTHVYAGGAEIVVDAFAAPENFRRVDAEVFRPLLRSLRISRPRGGM
jgi:hypothetical protein